MGVEKFRRRIIPEEVILPLTRHGTMATGDGKALVRMPFKATLLGGTVTVEQKGNGGGNTSVMLRNVTGAVDLMSAAVNVAGAAGAGDATVPGTVALSGLQNLTLKKDDEIALDIDAIPPTTASKDVTVYVHVRKTT